MNPLHIISHVACSRPGYLCEFLDRQSVPYRRVDVASGDPLPRADQVRGLILLGAPVSVNGDAPWIKQEMALVRACNERKIPVFGICFGGQLISKALGGEVFSAPSMQIGWHPVHLTEQGSELFRDPEMPQQVEALEWHEETFSLPPGALPLFRGGCIENQGFLLGSCLAVQFHPEVSEAMVREWVARYQACTDNHNHCIQHHSDILLRLGQRLQAMRRLSDRLFAWWLATLDQPASANSG